MQRPSLSELISLHSTIIEHDFPRRTGVSAPDNRLHYKNFVLDLTPFGAASYTAQSLHATGQVAQLVERGPEKAGVGGSIPSLATIQSKEKGKSKKAKKERRNPMIVRLSCLFPFSFYLFTFALASPGPVLLNTFFEKVEWDVLGVAAGSP